MAQSGSGAKCCFSVPTPPSRHFRGRISAAMVERAHEVFAGAPDIDPLPPALRDGRRGAVVLGRNRP